MPVEILGCVTAEDVKEVVRRYADQNVPGWECGGVSLRVGPVAACCEETILVMPNRRVVPSDLLRGAAGTRG
jgi:hypothetical protein